MTDEWNVSEGQDPQSLQIGFDGDQEAQTSQMLYSAGKQYLQSLGYLLVRHPLGIHAMHHLYKLKSGSSLPSMEGIKYPASFQAYVSVYSEEDIGNFEQKIVSMPDPLLEFWTPMIYPDRTQRKPLYVHTMKLLAAEGEKLKRDTNQLYELGISWNSTHPKPLKWIPRREWFSQKLQEVSFEEIFTIFPEAEREMLKLVLGRICVGRNNSLLPGGNDVIKHTARMAALIVGKDPGLGKSDIFKKLWSALGKVGYVQSTWNKPSDRFNLSEIITSDIIYKDDVCTSDLRAFLESDKVKIITTSGELRTEEKGVNAITTPCHGVLVLNSNEVNPRLVYGLDPGIIARVHQIATYREAELDDLVLPGISANTPNVRPFNHLPWLASQLGVSVDAIMLWACRLAADEFYRLIDHDPIDGNNPLADRNKEIALNLRYGFHKMVTPQFLLLLRLAKLFTEVDSQDRYERFMRKPTGLCWLKENHCNSFRILEKIANDKDYKFFRLELEKNWVSLNKPELHPWLALKNVNWQTLTASKAAYAEDLKDKQDSIGALSAAFKLIHLHNGFGLSYDRIWLTDAWETAHYAQKPMATFLNDLYNDVSNGLINGLDKPTYLDMLDDLGRIPISY